jgi:hypothetical protein
VRKLANGTSVVVPIVMGVPGTAYILRDAQNVKVDWHGQTWETGGSGSISCQIDHIDWTYIQQCSDIKYLGLADIGFAWLEEFGG